MTAYDFRVWLRTQHYADTTVRNYVNYLARAERDLDLRRATTLELEAWLRKHLTDSCSRGAKKALVKWYEWKGIKKNPALNVAVTREPRRLPRPHSRDDRAVFVSTAREMGGVHEVVGVLFASTGARFSSVRYARWHQLDLREEPYWHLVGKGSNRSGPRTHAIPLHPVAANVLRAWQGRCGSRDWVFPGGSRGGVISETGLRQVYRDVCEQAGLESVPHRQRHSLATLVLEDTDNIAVVQELLGHDNIASTMIYAKVAASKVQSAVEGLSL